MSWNIFSGRTAAIAARVPCSLALLFVGFPAQAEQGQDSFGYSTLEGVTATATKTARDPF